MLPMSMLKNIMMKNDFIDLMDRIAGRSKPAFFRGIIWIDRYGKWSLLDGDSFLFDEDMFQEYDFKDNLTHNTNTPNYSGLYEMEIRIHSYRSNNYDDPEEWDMNIDVVNWKLLDKSWDIEFE